MNNFGFIRVAAATPLVRVADCDYNSRQIIDLMAKAADRGVSVVVFPELSITSASCGDMYHQSLLLKESEKALKRIVVATHDYNMAVIVGLPMAIGERVYNCAAVVASGEVKGIIPKCVVSKEESCWFAAGGAEKLPISGDYACVVSSHQLFNIGGVCFGVELGENYMLPTPLSATLAQQGAKLIFNLSAAIATVGSRAAERQSVIDYSRRIGAAYVYSSAGFGESTSSVVRAGNAFIAENGELLTSNKPFDTEEQLIVADVDCELLQSARLRGGFVAMQESIPTTEIFIGNEDAPIGLERELNPMPFIATNKDKADNYYEEVFTIQTLGLMKRLSHTSCKTAVIGISGGLDSTLALLVTVAAFDKLGIDRGGVIGVTMPGFGTTGRTYNNAVTLMRELGITQREVSIAAACRQHFADIGLSEEDRSITFENAQARERTQILMDIANMSGGMVIGTGDMSELALGWATYNGDQMSMYGVNCNIAKTLVRQIVTWAANNEQNELVKRALHDIVATPVSPELLPAADGEIAQKTEDLVGPYELHDFFLYNFLRNGFSPEKILFLAEYAFEGVYDREVLLKWMKIFFRRFFAQQFKRAASPDGVKVCSVGVTPCDLNMPSDASAVAWLAACDKLN